MHNVAVVFTSANNGPVASWLAREVHYILGDRLSWLTSALIAPFARAAEQISAVSMRPWGLPQDEWRTLVAPISKMAHTGQNTYNQLAAKGCIPKCNTNDIATAIEFFTEYRMRNGIHGNNMAMLLTNYEEAMDDGCLDAYFHGRVMRVVVAENRTDDGIRRNIASVAITFLPDQLAQVKTLKFTGIAIDTHTIMQLADLIAMDALRWIHPVCASMAPRPVSVASVSDTGVWSEGVI